MPATVRVWDVQVQQVREAGGWRARLFQLQAQGLHGVPEGGAPLLQRLFLLQLLGGERPGLHAEFGWMWARAAMAPQI
eukprot:CAMPEP_0181469212 /NCGR_PEP_ID=MMETSP1110-20121109/37898_1 /TAXON_ID=174948 /ORGANISM="Symbiodinium sp., Strain CCMP421" /LENGTH=77 /DNA_ID=CAMNT_0023594103 /DNA_START=295 /DNA_END=528 /DNA_ORIENTATION=+